MNSCTWCISTSLWEWKKRRVKLHKKNYFIKSNLSFNCTAFLLFSHSKLPPWVWHKGELKREPEKESLLPFLTLLLKFLHYVENWIEFLKQKRIIKSLKLIHITFAFKPLAAADAACLLLWPSQGFSSFFLSSS